MIHYQTPIYSQTHLTPGYIVSKVDLQALGEVVPHDGDRGPTRGPPFRGADVLDDRSCCANVSWRIEMNWIKMNFK